MRTPVNHKPRRHLKYSTVLLLILVVPMRHDEKLNHFY